MEKKIGVYVCSGCGIGGAVDVDEVAKVAPEEFSVPICKRHEALCGPEGLKLIEADVAAGAVSHVVVAACSPRVKQEEFHFGDTYVERANLREHVAWCQPEGGDAVDATKLAQDYVRMALIKLQKVEAIESYDVGEIQIQRGFQNSNAVAVGAEYAFGKVVGPVSLDMRGGFRWEQSGIPTDYLTVATVDMNKYMLSVGGSLHIGRFRLDASYAHIFAPDVFVPPGDAKVHGVNIIRANPTVPLAVNGGTYTAAANIVGIGLAYQFDDAGPTPQPYGQPNLAVPGHGEYDGVPFGELPKESDTKHPAAEPAEQPAAEPAERPAAP